VARIPLEYTHHRKHSTTNINNVLVSFVIEFCSIFQSYLSSEIVHSEPFYISELLFIGQGYSKVLIQIPIQYISPAIKPINICINNQLSVDENSVHLLSVFVRDDKSLRSGPSGCSSPEKGVRTRAIVCKSSQQ